MLRRWARGNHRLCIHLASHFLLYKHPSFLLLTTLPLLFLLSAFHICLTLPPLYNPPAMAKIKIGINGTYSKLLNTCTFCFIPSNAPRLIYFLLYWWRIWKDWSVGCQSCFAERWCWTCCCQWSFYQHWLHGNKFPFCFDVYMYSWSYSTVSSADYGLLMCCRPTCLSMILSMANGSIMTLKWRTPRPFFLETRQLLFLARSNEDNSLHVSFG